MSRILAFWDKISSLADSVLHPKDKPADHSTPDQPHHSENAVLKSIAISPETISIAGGTQKQFTATGTYSDASTQDITHAVEWSTSADGVVAVNATGLASAQLVCGMASLFATDLTTGIHAQADVTVTEAAPQPQQPQAPEQPPDHAPDEPHPTGVALLQSITIDPGDTSIVGGTQQHFTATGEYSDGTSQDITASVLWSSSAPDVVAIDAGGVASAEPVSGTATITAMDPATHVSASTDVTVTSDQPQPPESTLLSLTIEPADASIAGGAQQQYTAGGTFSDGYSQDVTVMVQWSSSAEDVVTIDSSGLASAQPVSGTATITATDPTSGVTATTSVTVTGGAQPQPPAADPVLQSITIDPATATMVGRTQQQFTALGVYSDGSNWDLTANVQWKSSAEDVIRINPSGVAFAEPEAGKSTLTATEMATGLTASSVVTVTAAPADKTDDKSKNEVTDALSKTPPDEEALKKLVDAGGGKLLDEAVKNMPDPPDRAVITAAMQARFGLTMANTDAGDEDDDKAEGNKSIKQMYQTMLLVPEGDVRNNISLRKIERVPSTDFPFYEPDTKRAVVPAGRADTPGNQIGNTEDWVDGDGETHPAELKDVEEDCKPNGTATPKYLDWSTLHEVAHAVDDKKNVMGGKGGNAFADWKSHPVGDVAKIAAAAFKFDAGYIEGLLTDAGPDVPDPPNGVDPAKWEEQRKKAAAWCDTVRVGNNLWEKAAQAEGSAIGGRVYHEAYDNDWVSYKVEARKKGITGYQFRAAGEWYAELYAAFYTGKLKPTHPYGAWIKGIEAQK